MCPVDRFWYLIDLRDPSGHIQDPATGVPSIMCPQCALDDVPYFFQCALLKK
jgi:hypothetical protein